MPQDDGGDDDEEEEVFSGNSMKQKKLIHMEPNLNRRLQALEPTTSTLRRLAFVTTSVAGRQQHSRII